MEEKSEMDGKESKWEQRRKACSANTLIYQCQAKIVEQSKRYSEAYRSQRASLSALGSAKERLKVAGNFRKQANLGDNEEVNRLQIALNTRSREYNSAYQRHKDSEREAVEAKNVLLELRETLYQARSELRSLTGFDDRDGMVLLLTLVVHSFICDYSAV